MHKYVNDYLESEGIDIPITDDKSTNIKNGIAYRAMLTDALLKQINSLPQVFRYAVLEYSDHGRALDILGDCIEDAKETLNPNFPLVRFIGFGKALSMLTVANTQHQRRLFLRDSDDMPEF